MTTAEITIAEELRHFVEQYGDGYHSLELFRFFGKFPHAKFSELAVVNAFNSSRGKSYLKKALNQLVEKGVVRMLVNNSIPLYSITEDESLLELASNLAKLDWSRWQLILKQSHQSA